MIDQTISVLVNGRVTAMGLRPYGQVAEWFKVAGLQASSGSSLEYEGSSKQEPACGRLAGVMRTANLVETVTD